LHHIFKPGLIRIANILNIQLNVNRKLIGIVSKPGHLVCIYCKHDD